ncbi:hypothetical protein QTP88_001640 [Uroleucon formosanum]
MGLFPVPSINSQEPSGSSAPIPLTSGKPLQILTFDYLGPLLMSREKKYFIISTCNATKMAFAKTVANANGGATINFLMDLITSYGVPKYFCSDRGTHFKNKEVEYACKRLGYQPYTLLYGKELNIPVNLKSNPEPRTPPVHPTGRATIIYDAVTPPTLTGEEGLEELKAGRDLALRVSREFAEANPAINRSANFNNSMIFNNNTTLHLGNSGLQKNLLNFDSMINNSCENFQEYMQQKPLNDEFVSLFPMKESSEITNVDLRLKNSPEFEKHFKMFIKTIGGTKVKIFIKSVLSRLFTNKLAMNCSCCGLQGNCSTKFENVYTNNLCNHITLISDFEIVNNSINTVISNKKVDTIIHDHTLIHENSITNPIKNNKQILTNKLRFIISKYHVSHYFVNGLLTILREEELDVPKDVRTLLRTPKSHTHNILNINPETYIQLGVRCNIDSLPISRSSKACFWPILVSFVNCNIYNLSKIVIPIESSFINNRTSHLDINCALRTNESFREKLDDSTRIYAQYLPWSYKKLLNFWVKELKPIRLLSVDVDLINSGLLDLGQYLPSEFSRQPRSLEDIEF